MDGRFRIGGVISGMVGDDVATVIPSYFDMLNARIQPNIGSSKTISSFSFLAWISLQFSFQNIKTPATTTKYVALQGDITI
ncbi:hypothetical protein [Oceanobacillus senegalensis]|uniref:hypothetical protein n=1 Tax=Oceanobacillus senegalensis TaxID=1936063 RepID=UPI000A3050E6|nr:hypothetical protein [Oceanobacillus senegalensis]